MHTSYDGAQLYALDQVEMDSIERKLRDVVDYFRSDSMVCGPGRHGIVTGKIPVVGLDLTLEPFPEPVIAGKGPRFQNEEEIREILFKMLEAVRYNAFEGVIFVDVGASPPATHYDTFDRACELCVQARLMKWEGPQRVSEAIITKERSEHLRDIQLLPTKVLVPYEEDDKDNIFVISMGPLLEEGEGNPRYAPNFCVIMVGAKGFQTLHESHTLIDVRTAIQAQTRKRPGGQYPSGILYPHPRRFKDLVND